MVVRETLKNIYGVRYSKDEEYPINTIDFILHFPPFDVNEVIGRAHVWDNSKHERILYARIIDLLENKKIASQSTQRVKKREQDLRDIELLQMLLELDGQTLSVTP